MATPQHPEEKILDPRLRRLVHDVGAQHRTRLRADVDRAFLITSEDLAPGVVPELQSLSKRVLVKLSHDHVPATMAGLPWSKIVGEIYSVEVPVNKLRDLAATPGVQFISSGHPIGIDLDTSRVETRTDVVHAPPPPGIPLSGAGIVVGIIDYGCDYTLDDFRSVTGVTRIDRIWDQSLVPLASEKSPTGFPHGVEYTADDINFTLGVGTPAAGAVRVRHAFGPSEHGTHVMGIAAGNGRSIDAAFPAGTFIGMAPEATLIFVQPGFVDGATFTDSVHVAEAMAYIFRRAVELGSPCVINMSLGQNGGSHDGESVVERAVDRLLEEPGRALVVAAGNEQVWRGHASGTLVTGASRSLAWRVGGPIPGLSAAAGLDRTVNEMEIWYSSRDRFEVRVVDPAGNATPFALPDGPPIVHALPSGNRVFIESERFTVMNGDARVYIEVSPDGTTTIQSGIWRVEIHALESRDERFDAWIERDVRSAANNFADQSIFEGADFDPTMTLGTPATTRRAIAVANYRHAAPQAISASSSLGMTRDGRRKPEIAAPGTGIRSSNSLGGQPAPAPVMVYPMRIPMSGTSMASPHVAGIVALLLQQDPRLTSSQIAKVLISAARSPTGGGSGFDSAFGFGLIDARTAVDLII
jgi:subtilisin family serine protease